MTLFWGERFMNSSDNIHSLVGLYDKMLGIPTILVDNTNLRAFETYRLNVKATNEDLHCSILVQ